MKLAVFQFDVVLGEPAVNHARIFEGTRGLKVDLLVLPELCTSGYLLRPEQAHDLALEIPGPGLAPFERLAKELGAHVIAGVIERANGALYNTAVVVGPEGFVGKQRKLHVTSLERPLFAPGTQLDTFRLGAACVGILTCFDAWFPEVSRELCRRGAQLLCQPAAFGGPQTLDIMRVRSMENRVFSATANRTGREASERLEVEFRGESQVVDCDGVVLQSAGRAAATLVVELDLSKAELKANAMCSDLRAEWQRYQPRVELPNRRRRSRA